MNNWLRLLLPLGAALLGNLITTFGPAILSWNTLPSYVKGSYYREIKKEYSGIDDRLNEIFDNPIFYVDVVQELSFVKILPNGKIRQISKRTTRIRNMGDTDCEFKKTFDWENYSELTSVKIWDENNNPMNSPSAKDIMNSDPGNAVGHMHFEYPISIPSHQTIRIETTYVRDVEKDYEEPFVTAGTILGFYSMNVTVDPSFGNSVNLDIDSLNYETKPVPSGTTYTLHGPIFPGEGFSVRWEYKK